MRNIITFHLALIALTVAAPAFCQSSAQPAASEQATGTSGTDTAPAFGAASYGSAGGSGESFGTASFGGGSNAAKTDTGGDRIQIENANGQVTTCRPWVDQNCKAQ
jgi:Tfp pilus assembly protein FimT